MSALIITAKHSVDAIRDLIIGASMQGCSLHMAHLMNVCADDQDISYALSYADKMGVEIRGRKGSGYQSITDVHLHPIKERGAVNPLYAIFTIVVLALLLQVAGLIDLIHLPLIGRVIAGLNEVLLLLGCTPVSF